MGAVLYTTELGTDRDPTLILTLAFKTFLKIQNTISQFKSFRLFGTGGSSF